MRPLLDNEDSWHDSPELLMLLTAHAADTDTRNGVPITSAICSVVVGVRECISCDPMVDVSYEREGAGDRCAERIDGMKKRKVCTYE